MEWDWFQDSNMRHLLKYKDHIRLNRCNYLQSQIGIMDHLLLYFDLQGMRGCNLHKHLGYNSEEEVLGSMDKDHSVQNIHRGVVAHHNTNTIHHNNMQLFLF